MDFKYMIFIGIFVMGAFALQYYLGFRQITHFGEEYQRMRKEGRVAIGRRAGKITSGTLVLFALDHEDKIRYGRKLQGVTVYSKFKDFDLVNGRKIAEIRKDDEEIKKEIKITRLAVLNAVENFKMVRDGKVIPERKSPIGTITGAFSRQAKQ